MAEYRSLYAECRRNIIPYIKEIGGTQVGNQPNLYTFIHKPYVVELYIMEGGTDPFMERYSSMVMMFRIVDNVSCKHETIASLRFKIHQSVFVDPVHDNVITCEKQYSKEYYEKYNGVNIPCIDDIYDFMHIWCNKHKYIHQDIIISSTIRNGDTKNE